MAKTVNAGHAERLFTAALSNSGSGIFSIAALSGQL
jgi:hypothetical protein